MSVPAPADDPPELVVQAEAESVLAGTTEFLAPQGGHAKRYALVFGNGAYRHGDALRTPAKDAALMASSLRSRGYQVVLSRDRDLAGMQQDIQAFDEISRGAIVRVLYYAGHGFEFDNANYLLPVDAPGGVSEINELDIKLNALRLDTLLSELEEGADTLIAIIDACRVLPSRGATTSLTLAEQEAPQGTILAYATSPGQVAMDSLRAFGVEEDNSPYTYFLANALASDENETWDQAFLSTNSIVIQQTRGEQKPWMNVQVTEFPLIGDKAVPSSEGKPRTSNAMAWGVSPSRSAAGEFWAREAIAASRMERDGTQTDEDLRALARAGDRRAAIALASRWWEEPSRRNDLIRLLEPAAESGHAMAQTDLGSHLFRSRARDSKGRSASYWWQLASAQGVGEARAKLAMSDTATPDDLEEIGHGLLETINAFQADVPSASIDPSKEDN